MEKLSDERIQYLLSASILRRDEVFSTIENACTELLQLRKEVERLREALKPLAAMSEGIDDWNDEAPVVERWPEMPDSWGDLKVADIRRARAALSRKVDE